MPKASEGKKIFSENRSKTVVVYFWLNDDSTCVLQRHARPINYGQCPNAVKTINAIRDELFGDSGVPFKVGLHEFPDRDIDCVTIELDTGDELRHEMKNMRRITERRAAFREERKSYANQPSDGFGTKLDLGELAASGEPEPELAEANAE